MLVERTWVEDDKVLMFQFFENDDRVSFDQALALLDDSQEFRDLITQELRNVPFESYCWECRPISVNSIDLGFEFVVIKDDRLPHTANSSAFAEHLSQEEWVTSFENIGGDAVLVVPTPQTGDRNYAHLASFLRSAPQQQIDELWLLLVAEIEANIHSTYIWVSTAGHGVPWVHVRIDDTPKYYQFAEYKAKYQPKKEPLS